MARPEVLFLGDHEANAEAVRHVVAQMGGSLSVAAAPGELPPDGDARFRVVFVQLGADSPRGALQDALRAGLGPVIACANRPSISDAVAAMQAGANDYVAGDPVDIETLRDAVERIVSPIWAAAEQAASALPGVVAVEHRTLAACTMVARLADTDVPLLLRGEMGTGKGLLARRLHELSARRDGPFVEVRCNALPARQMEQELFGGPAPGWAADAPPQGAVDRSSGGTLLLRELDHCPQDLRRDLARAVRELTPEPDAARPARLRLVFANTTERGHRVSARLLAASGPIGTPPAELLLPPLRERPTEIPLLAAHFAGAFAHDYGRPAPQIARRAMRRLVAHRWPGNVRELRNAMHRAVLMAGDGEVDVAHLPDCLTGPVPLRRGAPARNLPLRAALREPERRYLLRVLRACEWNKKEAARRLRISRSTLYRKIQEHGLSGVAAS